MVFIAILWSLVLAMYIARHLHLDVIIFETNSTLVATGVLKTVRPPSLISNLFWRRSLIYSTFRLGLSLFNIASKIFSCGGLVA